MRHDANDFRSPQRLRARCLAAALALALGDVLAGAAPVARAIDLVPRWLGRVNSPSTVVVVDTCDDSGPGSLREAMASAGGADTTIDLDSLTCSTITLASELVDAPIAGTVRLQRAAGYVDGRKVPTLTIDAAAHGRVIDHASGGKLYIEGLRLTNGRFVGAKGGCLYAVGATYLNGVVVDGCSLVSPGGIDALGGAIYAQGPLNLNFCTISGSTASSPDGYAYGGGIFSAYSFGAFYSTIESNVADGVGYGGGVAARGGALFELSLVSSNSARYDGGIALFGAAPLSRSFLITGSTVALNSASGNVGGIEASGALYVYNSTVAFNSGGAGRASGIVMDSAATLEIFSTIAANNTAGGTASDISGAGIVNGSHDLVMASSVALPSDTISADPMLDPLGNHGGQTLIMPLRPGSPAIDAGNNQLNANCEQRAGNFSYYDGFITRYSRIVGANADIGAYESGADDAIFPNGFDGRPEFPRHCVVR